jgi:hypothetical protein
MALSYFAMTAIGRVSLAFTLGNSPLSSAKQTFRKHKSNVYESRLSRPKAVIRRERKTKREGDSGPGAEAASLATIYN